MHRTTRPLPLIAALFLLLPSSARAQGTGRSMDIDVSIRSAALGGASNALFWGEEQNHWANPALLCETRGIRYEYGRTPLVPGLADDVLLTSDVVKLGGWGAGIALSGVPGPGGVDLDYGTGEGRDENGNPTGAFHSFERVDAFAFGVSLPRAMALLSRGGRSRNITKFVDVSFGMSFKRVEIQLSPSAQAGGATGNCSDIGMMVRVTPVDLLGERVAVPMRLDFAYGGSVLNWNDEVFTFPNEDQSSPPTRHRRQGAAARLALDPPGLSDIPGGLGTFLSGLSPLVSVGMTSDRDAQGAGDQVDFRTNGWGVEMTLARVFSVRRGHFEDRLGNIEGETSGWAVGFPLGAWGGAVYQEATFPQASDSGLPDVHRKAFLAWIDPIAIARSFQSDGLASRMASR